MLRTGSIIKSSSERLTAGRNHIRCRQQVLQYGPIATGIFQSRSAALKSGVASEVRTSICGCNNSYM